MADTAYSPFKLPDEYIEQTKALRDETARELAAVRAQMDDLHERELRLMGQLSAMEEIIESVTDHELTQGPQNVLANNLGSSDGQGAETPTGNSAAKLLHAEQLPASFLRSPMELSPGSSGSELGDNPTDATNLDSVSTRGLSPRSPDLARSVDAVVAILRKHGEMHYRSIYEQVEQMGVSVIGKDPAAVLLSRFSRDSRVKRVGSGTYDIVG